MLLFFGQTFGAFLSFSFVIIQETEDITVTKTDSAHLSYVAYKLWPHSMNLGDNLQKKRTKPMKSAEWQMALNVDFKITKISDLRHR